MQHAAIADITNGCESVPIPIYTDASEASAAALHVLQASFTYSSCLKLPYGLIDEDPDAGCDCASSCQTSDCECIEDSGYFYLSDPSAKHSCIQLDALPPKLALYECGLACKCSKRCANRVVQKGIQTLCRVQWAAEKGFGLFADEAIPAGAFLCIYAGEVISKPEAQRRWTQQKLKSESNYILAIKEYMTTSEGSEQLLQTIVDPVYTGNIGRFMNHACPPAATHLMLPIRRTGSLLPMPALFAVRDIAKGEELTWDYQDAGGETWFYGREMLDGTLLPSSDHHINTMYESWPEDGIERSYGIIPLRERPDAGFEVLLIQHLSTSEYGFPKGHAETTDANPLAAAYRELLEETGLAITKHVFDPHSAYFESAYINPRTGKQKKVVVWAAMVQHDTEVTIQPEEILSYKWMPLDQVHTVASFKEDRVHLAELVRLMEARKFRIPR